MSASCRSPHPHTGVELLAAYFVENSLGNSFQSSSEQLPLALEQESVHLASSHGLSLDGCLIKEHGNNLRYSVLIQSIVIRSRDLSHKTD